MTRWPRLPPEQTGPAGSACVLVLGASGRAAAEMAAWEGLRPWVADSFGDWDLARWCPVVRVEPYPRALLRAVERAPRAPWLYTGAMENRPELLAHLARRRPLAGNPPEVLARVRNPWWVAETLARAGLPVAEVFPRGKVPPRDGRWLLKPLHSAGGWGIRRWSPEAGSRYDPARHYFQRHQPGTPASVLFLSPGPECYLLGLMPMWCGCHWAGAKEHIYCGSWGPEPVPPELAEPLCRLGRLLTRAGGLRGLWGADGLLTSQGFVPVEINPRITASAELVHLARGWPLVSWHLAAFGFGRGSELPSPRILCNAGELWRTEPDRTMAKVILYAQVPCRVPERLPEKLLAPGLADAVGLPGQVEVAFRDVPHPGTTLQPGQPMLSVLLAAPGCRGEAIQALAAKAARWLYAQLEPLPAVAAAPETEHG